MAAAHGRGRELGARRMSTAAPTLEVRGLGKRFPPRSGQAEAPWILADSPPVVPEAIEPTVDQGITVEDVDVTVEDVVDDVVVDERVDVVVEEPVVVERPTFRNRMAKARSALTGALLGVRSRSGITPDTWDDLEEALLRADVGVGVTDALLDPLRARVKAKEIE